MSMLSKTVHYYHIITMTYEPVGHLSPPNSAAICVIHIPESGAMSPDVHPRALLTKKEYSR